MDSTLSSFFLPLTKGDNATQDAVAQPKLTSFGFMNVHFGNSLNSAMEQRRALDQRKREGATQRGEPIDGSAMNLPLIALAAVALGIIMWRAR